jgi:nucleotide sugar dehydrogenase
MNVAVIGLGKIGLPLAVQYASKGHRVIGADINSALVARVMSGQEPFPGEADLASGLAAVVNDGRLLATTSTQDAVSDSDVVVVVVPVLVDSQGVPDFTTMDAAVASIGAAIQANTLVVFETTVPVGTTRDRFAPMLSDLSGLTLGVDLLVAFSPERVLTGRVFADLRRYPKIVGGIDETSARRAIDFYVSVLDFEERPDLTRPNGVWDLGSSEAAELAKLAETTYRDVNIALANQFALFADSQGIDILRVIEACNSQPYSHVHQPGVAVGGHCIPVYPHLYLSTDPGAEVVRAARVLNASMPQAYVTRLEGVLGGLAGRRVVILGAAYRGGVKETAFSGVFPLVEALKARGALPLVHDPLFTDDELRELGLVPFHRGEAASAAILQANHPEYLEWSPESIGGIECFLDGRAVTPPARWTGVIHVALGDGRATAAPMDRPPSPG